jgi:hypothetical protein
MTMVMTSEDIARMNVIHAHSSDVGHDASDADKARCTRWFVVRDSETGKPIANRDFVAEVAGIRQSGKTDEAGYAQIATDEERSVNMHVIFSSPRRDLKPRQEV